MKFAYRQYIGRMPGSDDFRLIVRPIVPLRVFGSAGNSRGHALVDTGADETLLPMSIAEELKIELDETATSQASGITGDLLTIRYGEVEFELSDDSDSAQWKTVVGFVDFGSTDEEVIVLGHGGCLDYFKAIFDGENAELTMTPNSLLPVG